MFRWSGVRAIAGLVTALGVGSTVAVFSVVDAVLLRSLPYGHPQKLVYIWQPNRNFKGVPDELGPNVPDFYDWQRLSHSFRSMALFQRTPMNLVRSDSSEQVGAAIVSGEFFPTLQASPHLGRVIRADDDRPGHQHVAVISDAFWRSRFGGTRDVIGSAMQLNRERYTVIGVLPKDFGFPRDGDVPNEHTAFRQTDIWLPAAYTDKQKTDRVNFASADAIARLRPGVPMVAAEAELKAITVRLQPLYPQMWRGWTVLLTPLIETIVGPVATMLRLLLASAGLVLLIAIGNVANLLLARAATRAHELGIRTALGANRWRIARLLLKESLLVSATGGALGVALAYGAVHLLVKLNPGGIPRFEAASVDGRVLVVALLLSLCVGVLAGLAPALSASKADVHPLLAKGGSRIAFGFRRGRFALIAVQVALSVILLATSGLLTRSYLRLATVDPGFSPATLTFRVGLDEKYRTPEQRASFYHAYLEKLRNLPEVRAAGASSGLPLSGYHSVAFAEIQGFGRAKEVLEIRSVTPGYRKALGTPLLRGRDFNARDAKAGNVVLVNRKFASLYFPARDPIGGHVRTGMGDFSGAQWATIIGVTGDVRHSSMEEADQPQIFQPADNGDNFAIASDAPTRQVLAAARVALRALDPVLTLDDVRTMRERITSSNAQRSFQTTLLTAFAGIAVALALAGLYGLMSFVVRQRTPEIGIRLALGSSRARILGMILSQGLSLTLAGLAVGVAGAFAATRLISSWLFGVQVNDLATFTLVPLFVLAVAACACLIPAWEAMRIEPLKALREE